MAIAYLRPGCAEPSCPPWLEGWRVVGSHAYALCQRATDGGLMVGVCDPLVFNRPARWMDADTDWKFGRVGRDPINHGVLARDVLWCDVKPVRDMREGVWTAPVVLTAGGERAFRVAYGANWLPALTPEQERAEQIARAAREALIAGGADMALACQWAAELLCVTYHLHPQVIAGLALLDDLLVPEVLGAAAGLELGVARGD